MAFNKLSLDAMEAWDFQNINFWASKLANEPFLSHVFAQFD